MGSPLIIAGFHRSGTSLTAQLLHSGGLFLGDELLGANPSNPYGHFEDRDVIRIHERILEANGMSWRADRQFIPIVNRDAWRAIQLLAERRSIEHVRWGFKDPRVCLLLPLWKQIVPDVRVLIVYRHFAPSTTSLKRRHASDLFTGNGPAELHRPFWDDPDLALRMWLSHNQALLAFANAAPRDTLALSFTMLQQGFPLIDLLNERWDLGLEPQPTSRVFDPAVTSSGAQRQAVSDRSLIPRVNRTWEALEALSERNRDFVGVGVPA